ncbi:hypothetical protein [Rugamonas aquatica]|uniref:Mercuric transport protein MerT n=1 Tax=Rugamonas aquatica TaxID=2743357 RepID=A0A6A7MWD3_9BURK|nr:hypothetical protein [Rugamonas aquatica]MQA37069.1 hypothetical protein [Rugamonas aquatica]
MTLTNKWRGTATTGAGVALTAVVACTVCCLPLVGPVVASLFAGVGAYCLDEVINPWYIVGAAAIAFAATFLWLLHRRRSRMGADENACGCQGGCGTDPASPDESVMDAGKPAPITCTLSAANFKERAAWLRELTSRALLTHQLDGSRLSLSYRLDAKVEVEKMVSQERECCGFLNYKVRRTATSIEVTVTAPANAGTDAQALFSHLIPE